MERKKTPPENLKHPLSESPVKIETVAAYVRVSTTEQKLHGLSLDAQKAKLTEYAEKNNMRIVEWYVDEGVSGRKLIRKRPELQRMIQDAEKGKFDRIIFIKLDRFFRSVAEYHECMKRIAPVLWTTTEEEYDLTTANGRMLVNMKLTIAELEADQTGERIDIVNEYKVTTGQPLSGSMPFGFTIETDPQTGRKKIVKHPDHEEIMEDLLEHFMRQQSKRKAITYLHAKYNVSIGYNSLVNLLRNPMLCGEYRGNLAYCEAYMTREEFDRLQEIVSRSIKENTTEQRVYIFSGLIKCPECGRRLAGTVFHITRPSGKTYKYKKYRCSNYTMNCKCSFSKAVNENVFERMMLEEVAGLLDQAKKRTYQIQKSDSTKVSKHNIEDLHNQIDRLNYSWQTGKIRKVETYEKQYADLLLKLEEAEAEQAETEPQDYSHIEEILTGGWKEIYNALDEEHRRAFWRSFISSINIEWDTEESRKITKVDFL